MAPPLRVLDPTPVTRLLPVKVLLVTIRVPKPKAMAPPGSAPPPLAMVRFWTVNVTQEPAANTPTMPPPLMVISPPPSMVVSALISFLLVTVIVAAPPQLKITLPPPGRQASNAASSQLALVPVPTTQAAKADQGAPSTAKASSARTTTNRGRRAVVFTAGPEPGSRVRREAQRGPAATTPGTILAARRASLCASLLAVRR